MTHGSLFSGIGGFDLASEWMGWENKFHCEWNEFGQKVLKYYWPNAESFIDITKSDFTKYANGIDILTGGFPCQPYSIAGKRKGKEDERHLWPEMLRAIREIQPRWVVGENVFGLVNWNGGMVFNEVQTDLEAEGYEVQPYVLSAVSVNAPHRRDRVWFIAHAICDGGQQYSKCMGSSPRENIKEMRGKIFNANKSNGKKGITPDTESQRYQDKHTRYEKFQASRGQGLHGGGRFKFSGCGNWENFPTQSPICNGNDGFRAKLDGITFPKWRNESIKAGGNAIVPQVALQIFKAIELYDQI